jgi:GrpB-like predicted nucleotidyltransferase (UPF0157 family)
LVRNRDVLFSAKKTLQQFDIRVTPVNLDLFMQIKIEPYDPDWALQFEKLRQELALLLEDLNPKIEHFGSTSVPGLAAKPVLDILVGIQDVSQFEFLTKKMSENKRYIYFKAFNDSMPDRRLFVRLKDEIDTAEFENIYAELDTIPHARLNHCRLAHVHVWKYNSENWVRHIAFREYLKAHDTVKLQYENLKKELSHRDWKNGMEYNDGKDAFIKTEEKKAIAWYLKLLGLP